MQDYHKLMQCFWEINAQDVTDIWQAIQDNKSGDKPKCDVGSWHSDDGRTFFLEIAILNSGGRLLRVEIGGDGKFRASIIFPEMD
ncbi:hypothetical protein [Solidesulfovibrio sp.]|uniref:hypothetical protein n=1 Tax=Solidesulfovibrio sp. TaxID=2910990 RepID=UPI002B207CC6|nr:hypothetical protein [Solidesulfovibrio sp.]MEA5088333.1 hypothetical protein [Solidesulfovibrio sp.]HML60317.1 hypothetical protein [Solidesulfovibrio sp.]